MSAVDEKLDQWKADFKSAPWWKKVLLGLGIAILAIAAVVAAIFRIKQRQAEEHRDGLVDKATDDIVENRIEAREGRRHVEEFEAVVADVEEKQAELDKREEKREDLKESIDDATTFSELNDVIDDLRSE